MHPFSTLVTFALTASAVAVPYQVSVAAANDDVVDIPITPSWAKEDKQRLIPISDKARTGAINPVVEEGLFSLVGPRFGNVFYENVSDDAFPDFKCFTSCPATVALVVPCFFTSGQNIGSVLSCVSKSSLCGCSSCLPSPLDSLVDKEICSKSSVVDIAAADRFSPYVDFATLATSSLALAAFRGDIYNYQIEELKTLNKQQQKSSKAMKKLGGDDDVHAMCIIGSGCGGCGCCVGGCVLDTCIGVCAG